MTVTYFRQRRPGPEARLEDAVVGSLPALFPSREYPSWTAGSLPIGAGMPDLVVVSFEPKVIALARASLPTSEVLAYLRAVGCARAETISERLQKPENVIIECLDTLIEADAVTSNRSTYCLLPEWRDILREIVTIEAKVSNWRKAVAQAARNRVFAHRSFIALPDPIAQRVRKDALIRDLGIGLLAVDEDGGVRSLKRARRSQPRYWAYYYQIAALVAENTQG